MCFVEVMKVKYVGSFERRFLSELDYVARYYVRKYETDSPFDISTWHSFALEYLPRIVKLAGDKLAELLHTVSS